MRMVSKRLLKVVQWVAAQALATLFATLPAAAQCVLCYRTVQGAGARVISVLKVGILILLIPTVLIFGAVALMLYRRRKTPGGEPAETLNTTDWDSNTVALNPSSHTPIR